ncbi:LysR family transcriptional regulator [Segnochrobactrum spirostomi]|uniref:LysR family transcriptional regulator n=1 Tax=Segnochrobactrum spirostomi TaxID=2608987 RepID=A0A6A7Y2Q1_9HYPH|nr:LysR family transcriptional regulator [Segnochrobactrum spirostomi]MQT12411.1 LysR family transcriptional regulator [Segnochrobactrum spirostomi]
MRIFRGAVSDGDLRLLRVFKTLVDHGGFAAAEVALDKTKSAISLDLTHLEERLGARLCTRGRAGFGLTNEGQIVYLAALQLFADLDKFRERVAGAVRRLTGTVSLMVVDNIVSVAADPLAEALGRFSTRHPEVEVRIESATPAGVERALLEGDGDLGISVVPRPVATLEMIPLFSEELRLYCGRGHPLFEDDAPREDEVRTHPLVRPSVTDDPAFAALVAGFPSTARASNLDTRVLLILSGRHLGFLPPHYAESWVVRGELREVLPQRFRGENMFYAMMKKSARPSAAAQALLQAILAAFGEAGMG